MNTSKTYLELIKTTPKSESFTDDMETLLDDITNPLNDLANISRFENLTNSEKALINNWNTRINTLRNEMEKWNDKYNTNN